MWTVQCTVVCFCICTAFLPKISSIAITEYEGKSITFRTSYTEGFETNSKYFSRSDTFFSEKLVETSESNRWTTHGRFAIFDNTSAHVIIATILNLTMEDSGSYTVGVDVTLLPDYDAEIQLTVMRAKAQKTTTPRQRLTTTPQGLTTPSQRFATPSLRLATTSQRLATPSKAFLPKISRAITEYEGKSITFSTSYLESLETNSKYFSRSGYFCEKLVETSESNRWTTHGRFAIFDNTSTHLITTTILNLTVEDSGLYIVAVDVTLWPDPETEIQLTVMRAEVQKTTTPPQRLTTPSQRLTTPSTVDVHNTNIPAYITPQNKANTEPHLSLMTVLMVVCACTFLLVCPFSLFKLLKSSSVCKRSASAPYHMRNTSAQVTEEYVKMVPVGLPDSLTDNCTIGKDFQRHVYVEMETDACYVDPLQNLDPAYTEMNPNLVQESIYQTID
ncbi:uncharacterized protein isoform X2 [Danio rerio]|uniref:Uncharacterized protein isoform X2 n=1 Tax=Danio rerio TaxID=7955 RepID=A0AC58G2N2_DANRE